MTDRSSAASPGHTVLIVDDDPAVRGSLQFCLEVEGFLVRTYASAAELLNDEHVPENGCLVIDYRLPSLNGLDLLSQLRQRRIMLPAILVTSHPSEAVRQQISAAGAVLIEKPLLNEALLECIRTISGLEQQRKQAD
jgi:FixJ family two-component response regulator